MAPYPSGKGEVCKTFMHRFESDRRLLVDFGELYLRFFPVKNWRDFLRVFCFAHLPEPMLRPNITLVGIHAAE
jgi:hypothetical protein